MYLSTPSWAGGMIEELKNQLLRMPRLWQLVLKSAVTAGEAGQLHTSPAMNWSVP